MTTEYVVETFHTDRPRWFAELAASIAAEVTALGIHHSVSVTVRPATGEAPQSPTVGVYFGSPSSKNDAVLVNRIAIAASHGVLIIPVVESMADFATAVPHELRYANGWAWTGSEPSRRLARKVLEELGIEDRRRRVFISHKRDDGLAAAEQLHDFLSHYGFEAFIDRFGVGLGRHVQNEIADALEDCAFLLLVETPLAHLSDWVFDEVEYALSHQMGMHIITWPGNVPELPGTNRLPRQILSTSDVRAEKGYEVLTEAALDDVLAEVEALHANAITRRRRYLLQSVEDAARAAGRESTPLEGWRLLVTSAGGPCLVQVSARLPTIEDLHGLDQARTRLPTPEAPGVLVHAARVLEGHRRDILAWSAGTRTLTLIPENAIGGYWT